MGSGSSSRARGWLRYLPAILYLVGGVAALLVSWRLYPTASPPSRPAPAVAAIGSDRAVSTARLTIQSPLGRSGDVVITVSGTSDSKDPGGAADVFLVLPDVLLVPGLAAQVQCDPGCTHANEFGQGSTMARTRFELKPAWKPADDGTTTFTAGVGVPRSVLAAGRDPAATVLELPGMNCSKVACRGSVPLVVVTEGTPIAAGAMARVNFRDPTLMGYQWSSALSPYTEADVGLTFNYPIVEEPELGYLALYSADGANIDQERRAQYDTFVAGAVVGVAGALLLGAVQDAVTVTRDRDPRPGGTSRTRPKTATR